MREHQVARRYVIQQKNTTITIQLTVKINFEFDNYWLVFVHDSKTLVNKNITNALCRLW